MKRYALAITVLALLVIAAASLGAASRENRPQNIILIGWDGVQREHLKECIARNEIPHLMKLSSEGAMVDIDVNGATDTKAGWAQILTGYKPEITGVYSNKNYRPIPKGYTVFERLENSLGNNAIVTAAIIAKNGNVGAKPGQPYFYTKEGMDLFINALGKNEAVTRKALETMEKYKNRPFFFFIHYGEVDHMGHRQGENSKEYNDAIVSCDTALGLIVKKLRELKLYDRTLVYVTADHGFDEGMTHHHNAPRVFLATNDKGAKHPGHREDITPTIVKRFGLDLKQIKPPLDGKPLDR
ncbi:MAG: alkaline phosphatase family protein [Candidatus Eremiobacteraeota bacterium]|nr:alkaline phosphatase family protein [Candidatus Eremiobacteraeota bacterium]